MSEVKPHEDSPLGRRPMTDTITDAMVEAAALAMADGLCWTRWIRVSAPCGQDCLCLSTARAALSAAERAAWRTIDSAPKDGTVILLDWTGDVISGFWDGYHQRWCIQLADGSVWDGKAHDYQPARWRPLPAPPEGTR